MREAAEARNDFVMTSRIVDADRSARQILQRSEQRQRTALNSHVFSMLERQIRERPLRRAVELIEAAVHQTASGAESQRIRLEGASFSAKHVAWKLVEDDDERESSVRRRLPRAQPA